MNISKTKAAFRLSAEGLFAKYPRIYMWTVTFARVQSDWEGSRLFSKFLNHLREVVGRTGWGGLRVVELHKEHGIHYHLLVTERLAVDLVRRVGRCYGIGRIHVCRADRESAAYLSKYLSKQRGGPRHASGRRMRRWAAFGDVPRVRVSDMVNDSPMWIYRREKNLWWLGLRHEVVLTRAWEHGREVFKACWFCLKRGEVGDGMKLALERLEVREEGLVERFQNWGPF